MRKKLRDMDKRVKKKISVGFYRRDLWGGNEYGYHFYLYLKHLKRCQDTGGIRKGKNGVRYRRICYERKWYMGGQGFRCPFMRMCVWSNDECKYDVKKCFMKGDWVIV